MIEDLDRIYELGFFIDISWNDYIKIYANKYKTDLSGNQTYYNMNVLYCYFHGDECEYEFKDMIKVCCTIFNEWYNKNLNKIKNIDDINNIRDLDKLQDSCPGDVKKQVARELKLDYLLEIFKKS